MAITLKTPDVYIQEIPVFPPSVAEVATGIPAFIGYTERAEKYPDKLNLVPTRISSMKEYEQYFGRARVEKLEITIAPDPKNPAGFIVDKDFDISVPTYLLWYAVRMFYDNGGGPCWIVSVGDLTTGITWDKLKSGLDMVALEDEPTLLVMPEMVMLGVDYKSAADAMLSQAGTLGDRFAILDVDLQKATSAIPFNGQGGYRARLGTENLKYGAAYYPYVWTTLAPQVGIEAELHDLVTVHGAASPADSQLLSALKTSNTAAYNFVRAKLAQVRVAMPPSGAVAGIYAATDRVRGVWKAPANVALADVVEPTVKVSSADQMDLNVDAGGGKSINVLRSFTGRGTLVWGARTLAGNDNEWRYVPVRRFFNMVEESVKKSTAWAVFEPNDASLWAKVRGMIENYLIDRWRDGALVGATPKDAFFVRCGLGTTMTPQDVLEGILYVEIGMAVVRPAEFIVLRFYHKLQTS